MRGHNDDVHALDQRVMSTAQQAIHPVDQVLPAGQMFAVGLQRVAPTFFDKMPGWLGPLTHSGITFGAVAAVFLNLLYNGDSGGDAAERELAAVAASAGRE
jgi:xanthine/uracil permease